MHYQCSKLKVIYNNQFLTSLKLKFYIGGTNIICDMMCHTTVQKPSMINFLFWHCHVGRSLSHWFIISQYREHIIKMKIALTCWVPMLTTYLTSRSINSLIEIVSSPASTVNITAKVSCWEISSSGFSSIWKMV